MKSVLFITVFTHSALRGSHGSNSSGSVCGLTSAVSGEVEQQDVGAEVVQVVEGLQVLLQFPVGQFGLQDGR